MEVIVVGCGRVGAELASALSKQNIDVTVIDPNPKAFERLEVGFQGRTVEGVGIDQEVLLRAGIETAHGFAAVTSSDNVNFVSARIARDVYNVEHVVARIYNPEHTVMFRRQGLQTVASSSWGAQRIGHLLTHPGLSSLCTAGNGQVTFVEVHVPEGWVGQTVGAVTLSLQAHPAALVRGGAASLPSPDDVLIEDDLLVFSTLTSAMPRLAEQVNHHNRKG